MRGYVGPTRRSSHPGAFREPASPFRHRMARVPRIARNTPDGLPSSTRRCPTPLRRQGQRSEFPQAREWFDFECGRYNYAEWWTRWSRWLEGQSSRARCLGRVELVDRGRLKRSSSPRVSTPLPLRRNGRNNAGDKQQRTRALVSPASRVQGQKARFKRSRRD
jgi:hypothetical protein